MTQNPDVIVVGGGLIGMMSAWELSRTGLSVCLLERGDTGGESSWAGGGILSPLYPWRYDDAVSQLAKWSQQRYPDLLAELHEFSGIDPEYRQSGLLVLDVDDADRASDWSDRFAQPIEWLAAEDLRKLSPGLGVSASGSAAWFPSVGQARNPRLVKSLRKAAERSGVDVQTQCEVVDFEVSPGRVTGVKTRQGEVISADRVVLTGGAWTTELLAKTGVNLEVQPVRGQMLLYRAEPSLLEQVLLYQSRYLIPRRDGRILVGSTIEYVGFDKSTTDEARVDLCASALEILPGLEQYPVEHHWAGLRPGTPDGIPYICEHPQIEGLFVNAGHFRNGVVLAPASVRLLVDLVLGRESTFDPHAYRVKADY